MAAVGIAGQRRDMGDELTTAAVIGDRDLDAAFIGLVGLAFADAFDLGSMQGVDLPAAFTLAQVPDAAGQRQRQTEGRHKFRPPGDLASDVADHRTQHGAQPLELPVGPLALLGVSITLILDQRDLADPRIGLA